MKKIVTLFLTLALLLALCFSACAETEVGKVAYIARTQSDAFAAELCNQFIAQAENYADTFTLDIFDAQGDSEKQNSLIEDCIVKGYDCIIVQPNDGELQRPYCQAIMDAGIFCITTNAAILDLEGSSQVDGDPYQQGQLLTAIAAEAIPEGGKIGILDCLPGNFHTISRNQAFQDEVVAVRDDLEVVGYKNHEEASEASAMATVEDWAQSFGRIDALLCTADVLGLGAYEAVKGNSEFEGMQLYSVDCLAQTVLYIKDGVYTATVYQNPPAIAAANLEAAYKLLTGEETQVITSVDSLLCTSENVDRFIQMYIDQGAITEEEAAEHGYVAGTAESILKSE